MSYEILNQEDCLTQNDWKLALQVQTACNMGGLAITFSKMVHKVWHEATIRQLGTGWVNTHPIITLYLDKMCSLNHTDNNISAAYKAAEEILGKETFQKAME